MRGLFWKRTSAGSGTYALVIVRGPMSKSTRQRLLELMMARIGRSALAAGLGVPCAILADWINGDSLMPDGKVIALLHLIDYTGRE